MFVREMRVIFKEERMVFIVSFNLFEVFIFHGEQIDQGWKGGHAPKSFLKSIKLFTMIPS